MEHILTSSGVKVVVRPDLGARVDQITDLETGKDWLWTPDRYRGRQGSFQWGRLSTRTGAGDGMRSFRTTRAGRSGDAISQTTGSYGAATGASRESSASKVRLACDCSTLPAACEKRIAVTAEGLTVGYRLQNLSGEALPFLLQAPPCPSHRAGRRDIAAALHGRTS